MNTLMKRDLNTANRKGRGIMLSDCTPRKYLLALIALVILLPCLLSKTSASASNFDLHLKDQETGDDLFVNFITGDYMFFNAKKQSFIAGKGKVKIGDCAMELKDAGPNRNRPDRQVHVFFNPCDNVVNAACQVFDSGEDYAIKETAWINQNQISASADLETAEPSTNTRFDGFCLEDDSKNYILSSNGVSYTFVDRRKGVVLQGEKGLITNGCKTKLIHDGADPKHPDRHIYAEVNTCTREAMATVWLASTRQTYLLNDTNMLDSRCTHTRND